MTPKHTKHQQGAARSTEPKRELLVIQKDPFSIRIVAPHEDLHLEGPTTYTRMAEDGSFETTFYNQGFSREGGQQ